MSTEKIDFISPFSLEECLDILPVRIEKNDANQYIYKHLNFVFNLAKHEDGTRIAYLENQDKKHQQYIAETFLPSRKAKQRMYRWYHALFPALSVHFVAPISVERSVGKLKGLRLIGWRADVNEVDTMTYEIVLGYAISHSGWTDLSVDIHGTLQAINPETTRVVYKIGLPVIAYTLAVILSILMLVLSLLIDASDATKTVCIPLLTFISVMFGTLLTRITLFFFKRRLIHHLLTKPDEKLPVGWY